MPVNIPISDDAVPFPDLKLSLSDGVVYVSGGAAMEFAEFMESLVPYDAFFLKFTPNAKYTAWTMESPLDWFVVNDQPLELLALDTLNQLATGLFELAGAMRQLAVSGVAHHGLDVGSTRDLTMNRETGKVVLAHKFRMYPATPSQALNSWKPLLSMIIKILDILAVKDPIHYKQMVSRLGELSD